MAVQVGHARQHDRVALVTRLGGAADIHGRNAVIVEGDPDIVLPAIGQQRLFRKDHRHVRLRI